MTDHAEIKRKQRADKRAEGYVLKHVWVKPECWDRISKFIKLLHK